MAVYTEKISKIFTIIIPAFRKPMLIDFLGIMPIVSKNGDQLNS